MFKRIGMIAVITVCWVVSAQAESLKFEISGFLIEGNTLLPMNRISQTLAPFTGTGREMADVNKAAAALQALYHRAGYAVVQVSAPAQTLVSGKVRLQVVEDKVALIEVKGNTNYSADNIRASLPVLQLGKSIHANRLEAAIALANENAAKQVAVNVQPGAQLGELNTRIDVSEDRVSKWLVSLDNTGSSTTGYTKLNVAYQHANVLNRDHAMSLQYNTSPDALSQVGSLSAGYHIPFYQYGGSLDLIAAYSSSSTQNGTTYFAGKGTVLGARFNYALAGIGELRHKLIFGADYKATDSAYTSCVAPCSTVTEQPLSFSYFAQMNRSAFQASGSVSWVSNLSGGAQNSAVNYQSARGTVGTLLATPNWRAWRINASGAVPLPKDWQVRAVLNGQHSRNLLLSAEQFGAGGATSVRGYPERVAAGERGYATNVEIYTPDLNRYIALPNHSVRALLFWDNARVTLNDEGIATLLPHTYLSSVGWGVRVVHRKDVSLKLDVGWAQRAVSTVPRNDVRAHLALSFIF